MSTQEDNRPWSQRFNPHGQWRVSLQERLDCGSYANNLKQPAGLASFDLNSRQVTILTNGFAG
jgi:hypothetical protein